MRTSVKTILCSALLFCLAFISPLHADDVITNVMSSIVSFQYPDNFSNQALTNGGIMSPIVSYQYFEWPGDDVLQLLSSAPVSYFYNVGTGTTPLAVQGQVVDATGHPLAGATVTASVLQTAQGSTQSAPDGTYMLPPLLPGVYQLAASGPSLVSDRRVVSLSATTARQDFLLRPLPLAPPVQDTGRTPTAAEIPSPASVEGSQLKVFDGTRFVPNLALLDPSKLTVVLSHGWIICGDTGGIDFWPTDMAKALRNKLTKEQANIVGWDWHDAANPCVPPNPPEEKTPAQGLALGKALYDTLGANYAPPVHFMGHSLGTQVNAYAATYLQGQPLGRRAGANPAWRAAQMQMTLFDEAELARIIGQDVIVAAGLSFIVDQPVLPSDDGTGNLGFKSPLPPDFLWADNYMSVVGVYHSSAVNVALQRAVPLAGGIVAAHSYPMQWYEPTIATPSLSGLGFTDSFEAAAVFGSAFPPTGDNFAPGAIWHQVASPAEEHRLERVSGLAELPYELRLPQAVNSAIDFAGAVVRQGVAVGEKILDAGLDAGTKFGNATISVVEKGALGIAHGFNSAVGGIEDGFGSVVDLFNRPGLSVSLVTGSPPSGHRIVKAGDPGGPTNTPAYLWLPVFIPADALAMAFDYTVAGDPADDQLAFGLNGTNLLSVAGQFVPTNTTSVSRLIDVSAQAGATNEFFFGITGGTSTNCTVTVQNIRFFTLQPPALTVDNSTGAPVLSWPSTANGYALESTTRLTSPEWTANTNPPALFAGRFSLINTAPDVTRFFRLRRR